MSNPRIIPTHKFLFSPDFQKFYFQQGLGNYYSVDVSGGRLLAELVLIAVISGVAFFGVEYLVREFRAMTPNIGCSEARYDASVSDPKPEPRGH
jgi:hypothetical protein